MKETYSIFWFRRDLRFNDNAGLFHALSNSNSVIPLFIFDLEILEKLENKCDARVQFIYETLNQLNSQLLKLNRSILIRIGNPIEIFASLISEYNVDSIFMNRDIEPYALKRDASVRSLLADHNIRLNSFLDHTIFGPDDILKADGLPYTIYTPYSRRWKDTLAKTEIPYFDSEALIQNFAELVFTFPKLEQVGFKKTLIEFKKPVLNRDAIVNYGETRDFPAKDSTTHNGIHLRFGTISIRELVKLARKTNETFLNELIWREFFMQILFNFQYVEKQSFNKKYEGIPWRNNEEEFACWCTGKTGYPLVDAGMRELNETGFMHNRVRMVTASFLSKHLLIDWRWGESYFASKLLDFELSANNGNWQWAAGCGCDAAPYFRVFNPTEQQKKFDPDHIYCKKWIPELFTIDYPLPIVDHVFARNRAISAYKEHLNQFKI
jgi:deoxyribodipyrimidine photo-lyase